MNAICYLIAKGVALYKSRMYLKSNIIAASVRIGRYILDCDGYG